MTTVSTPAAERAAPEPRGLLAKLGLHRRELRAWAVYDWANSAMVCVIATAVFPIYFVRVAGANLAPAAATQRYANATTIGLAIIAVLAPILGVVAAAVACMFFIERGDVGLAALLFILANIGANGSFVFYESLLPHVARD